MKRKLAILAIVALCAATITTGTWAFTTVQDNAHNIITSTGVNIEIEEYQKSDEGLTPYPEEPLGVMPGTTVSKIAVVKNLETESYIRAGIEITITTPDGKEMELTQKELDALITTNAAGDGWVDGEDGWYYYEEAVGTESETDPLFTEVTFDGPNMTNEYQSCTIEIQVTPKPSRPPTTAKTPLKPPVGRTKKESENP